MQKLPKVCHFLLVVSMLLGASAVAEDAAPGGSELPWSEIAHIIKSRPKSVEAFATADDIDVVMRALQKDLTDLEGTLAGAIHEGPDSNMIFIGFRTEQAKRKWKDFRAKKKLPSLSTVWCRPDQSLVLIRFEVFVQPPAAAREGARKGTPPPRQK